MADGPRVDTGCLKEDQVCCMEMALPGCQCLCDLLLKGSLAGTAGRVAPQHAKRDTTVKAIKWGHGSCQQSS